MVIAALLIFAALLIAWILAPTDTAAGEESTTFEAELAHAA